MKYTLFAVLALALTAGVAAAQQMQHQHPMAGAPAGGGMGQGPGPGMMAPGHVCGPDCPMHGRMGMMGKGGTMGGGIIRMLMMNADELKLTDEQLGKLHRQMWKNLDARKDLRTKLRDTKLALHKAMMDPAADDAAIRAAAKAHTDAFNAKIDAALKDRAAALAILTPAQQKQAKSLKPPKKPMWGTPPEQDDDDNE